MSLLLERLALGSTPTDIEVMLYSIMWHRKGGRNRERKCHIPRTVFCTKAKIAKGGGVLRDTTVYHRIDKFLQVYMTPGNPKAKPN